jgi:clathrin heavy chain
MVKYSTANGYKPDYLYLMQRMMMDNPEAAVNLAKMVARQPGPPIDLNTMTDLFLQVCTTLCHAGTPRHDSTLYCC